MIFNENDTNSITYSRTFETIQKHPEIFHPSLEIHYRFCILKAPLIVTEEEGKIYKRHLVYLIMKMDPDFIEAFRPYTEDLLNEEMTSPRVKKVKSIENTAEILSGLQKEGHQNETSEEHKASSVGCDKQKTKVEKLKELLALLLIQLDESILPVDVRTTNPLLKYELKEQENVLQTFCKSGAADTLLSLLKYEFRLANEVINYPLSKPKSANEGVMDNVQENISYQNRFCAAVDNVLSNEALNYMTSCFGPKDSISFYKEHGYGSSQIGYFSYLYALKEKPSNGIEAVIAQLHEIVSTIFPKVKKATVGEWWVHKRSHGSGHQLHFDSENEGRGGISALHHPIVSCVLVIDGDSTCGGPTLVTNQKRGDGTLATEGWLLFPRRNRLLMFDGSLLHGVIPGRPFSRDELEMLGEIEENSHAPRKRVTFMVGFWDSVMPLPFLGKPSASQRFPSENGVYTWSKFAVSQSGSLLSQANQVNYSNHKLLQVEGIHLTKIWCKTNETVKTDEKENHCPQYDKCFQGF